MNIVAICFIMMLLLFMLKLPIYIAMLIPSVFYFIAEDINIAIMVQRMVSGLESTSIVAIPFFMLSGALMNYTGITKRMIAFAEVVTGHMRGGLAQVNVLLSTLMGGLSGSNIADCAMEAKILVPDMLRQGYSNGFSTAVTAFSSLITPLIPPGLCLITYSVVANVSVGRMFAAGLPIGLLTCAMEMLFVDQISKKRGYKPIREKKASGKEILTASKTAIFALILPVVLIGGIRVGIFTATEAGVVAVVYALLIGVVVYHELKFTHFKIALSETVETTAMVMAIFAAANCFTYFVSNEGVAEMVSTQLFAWITEPWQFFLILNIVLLIAGMFMEGGALAILLVPLCMGVVDRLGIDLIQFGCVFCLNVSIGTLTPPVGTVLYTTCQVTGCRIEEFFKEGWSFYVAMLILLVLVSVFPGISTFIPNLIYG